ncbi:MAG: M23 family metallopeptidase [Candidatus Berkiellales bacterium]
MSAWLKRHSKLYRSLALNIRRLSHTNLNAATTKTQSVHLPLIGLICGFLFAVGLSAWTGYQIAIKRFSHEVLAPHVSDWQQALQADQNQVQDLELQTKQNLEVLTQYVGHIEANLLQLNALGERLVSSFYLDPTEFNFNDDMKILSTDKDNKALLHSLKELDAILEKRYVQMSALEQALQMHSGQRELKLTGTGKAVTNGWISSFFGSRRDPITGHKAWHKGVDIAGKEGSPIKALASGVVSFANSKSGYGRLVEINHGNGLSTRYGHNKELLVSPGELVRKGQTIAYLGSSGRSTGPHLHLEVRQNGKAVDPGLYFPDLKRS